MASNSYDVLVLGSGFGGSLLSAILAKSGMSVAMVDRARHPRFAIGESSTPLADSALARIAKDCDLPELMPLTKYGFWKRSHPELTCGLKRGFSYFGHRHGQPFDASDQLVVAASASDDVSDTQWLRSDVDQFLFQLANQVGALCYEGVDYHLETEQAGWRLTGVGETSPLSLRAEFVVDATGPAGVVLETLGIADQTHELKTRSQAVFGHFAGVRTVADMLVEQGVDCDRHPFSCDAAAVHHVLDDGWMWQLRFDDGTVSCGHMLPALGAREMLNPRQVWDERLSAYPFLSQQFSGATLVRPSGGLQATGRLQRLTSVAAGKNWAALPSTAGFIDPLHSTGIAHTLFGVRRIAAAMLGENRLRQQRLQVYSQAVIDELKFIDQLVEGCYAGLPHFRLWSAWCMLYFAAVTSQEHTSDPAEVSSFLGADDVEFGRMLIMARQKLQATLDGDPGPEEMASFESWLRDALQPWNRVGLLSPEAAGMYASTAAPM
ncbi:NAD(P)/FAD-dependent oxidoreductase [Neorhodopirellula lusitana]|uniref:NAD(P)/FAD-dependent oxidoreductase n=1 Tax=Neorhodopirellula lusitana TaxID=445327 RepID=UPI003850BAF2